MSTPNPMLTSFLKIWKVILQRLELLSFSFKGDNIL